jgi:hypothetical protein
MAHEKTYTNIRHHYDTENFVEEFQLNQHWLDIYSEPGTMLRLQRYKDMISSLKLSLDGKEMWRSNFNSGVNPIKLTC